MKGGRTNKSPKWGGAVCFLCLAGLILIFILLPTASAWSFPFSIPFLSKDDGGPQLSLDLHQILVDQGSSASYTISLKNSGKEVLSEISVTDNFGQVGFIARLPAGETVTLSRTTPPLTSSTRLAVSAASGGDEICRAEADLQVGPPGGEISIPAPDFDRSISREDQRLKVMSASPQIDLVVGADPAAVRPGEKTTVRMTVTNRGQSPLRDVIITAPGFTVEAADLSPGESKTFSRSLTIAEDLSAEVVATGTSDGGETATDRESLVVAAKSSELSVTVVSIPGANGLPATTEYRLANGGGESLSRVTLKDGSGTVLGILARLGPGDSRSLTRKDLPSDDSRGPVEVSAVSSSGRTVTGDVILRPAAPGSGTGASQETASRSTSSTSRSGAIPDLQEMSLDLDFDEIDSGFELFDTRSEGSGESGGAGQSRGSGYDPGFEPEFDFGDLEIFADFASDGSVEAIAPSVGEGTQAGSPKLVVTLQVNRSRVHKGGMVEFRSVAVNRGTATISEVELRCGGVAATAPKLAPGDGLPLEGAVRADGDLNLTAAATARGPGGSKLADERSLEVKAVSPDLKIEVHNEPDKISRGERISIAVRVENVGDDPLSQVRIFDDLGEIGRIPVLGPGEARTVTRNSTLEASLQDVVRAQAVDSAGFRLHRSETLTLKLLEPGLELTVDPAEVAAYPGESAEVVWTIRNSGEVDLLDVTFEVEGMNRFRLPSVPAGGSTPVSSVHLADESRQFMGRAEGRTPGGETVADAEAMEIRVVSPGIGLNVRPSEVEASMKRAFNLTFLVTNTGDDPLRDVTLQEKTLGTLEKIGRLEPGDFKVATLEFLAETNTTLRLEAAGTDSRGKKWSDSRDVPVKIVSASIDLTVRADPPETTPGGTVDVVCTVENRGDVPIFSTFIMRGSKEHLGTIDYISPGSSRTVVSSIEASTDIEEEITAEGFTQDKASVRDTDILTIAVKEPGPPAREDLVPTASEGPGPGSSTTGAAEVSQEEGPLDRADMMTGEAPDVRDDGGFGVTGLLNRLREILEEFRLKKEGEWAASSAEDAVAAGSEAGYTSSGTRDGLPATSTRWSGYGTHEGERAASPLSPDGALPEGSRYAPPTGATPGLPAQGRTVHDAAGYAYSSGEAASGKMPPLRSEPEKSGHPFSAGGIAASYLSSPGTGPGSAGYAYSSSGPASSYLSSPSATPGSGGEGGYASSSSGPFSAPSSPAGISPTITGSTTPTGRESGDPRSALEASAKVADSRGSAGISSRDIPALPSPGYAEAAAPEGSPALEKASLSRSPDKNIRLTIGDIGTIEIDRPPKIIDVGAFPPDPTAWTPVVVAVHASDDMGIKSVDMLWNIPSATVSRMDMADITKINSQKMVLEDGDAKEGYWSYEIPGQAPGTYMAVFVRVSDGERWAEDGPYILFWSGRDPVDGSREAAGQERPPVEQTPTAAERDWKAPEMKGDGMLFVESTTVIGRGDVSIKNEFRESSARYKEELDGRGSIEMQSEKTINRGNPVVNITDSRLLVFDQGYLKGVKVMESPGFHGGMGASVIERFNATTLEKSETGTLSTVNRSHNTLLFNTQQAFEGIWGTRTEYSNFNKKIKADQRLTGTFETQKKITFED